MSQGGYKIRNPEGIYFITFAVVGWVDVFSRRQYREMLVESLAHCQREKQLILHAWCVMTNHVHMITSASNNNLSDILRDFKKYTSSELIKAIAQNPQESRKEWMLNFFKNAGEENSRNTNFQFWQQDNQPKECFSHSFTQEKVDYVHNNPVEAGLVANPEDYLYSSASNYAGKPGLLKVELLW